jgi:parallel beta-helix repeat protein
MHSRRKRSHVLTAIAALAIACAVLASCLVEWLDVPPRALAPYIERRVSQHNPVIVQTGKWVARRLMLHDRGESPIRVDVPLRIGAQAAFDTQSALTENLTDLVHVDTTEQALNAIANAEPGQTILLSPGKYRFHRPYIAIAKPGTSEHRIVMRADRPGTVMLELDTHEGFLVTAPYWTFENLHIQGVCQQHSDCEHAFHVVGNAHHFIARNNTIVDFNAHFKINGASGQMPDDGIIDRNTLTNTGVRNTDHSVTLIDLVAASRWQIRHNLITDFVKGGSDKISYGAFVKGGGADNRLEQNMVVCENLLKAAPGQRVGLSLGGGGTGKSYCRDRRCITEQDRGVIASNLIASCSDDGIYVNRSAGSKILHNTIIDTGGIVVRFPESSADVEGNLVDGSIRTRDDGIVRQVDNLETSMTNLYLGMHPVRHLLVDDAASIFQWTDDPPRRKTATQIPLDLCGSARPRSPVYGAFENFSTCLRRDAQP